MRLLGRAALDAWPASRANISRTQRRKISIQQLDVEKQNRRRILILGSGWAGYTLARGLDSKQFQVVVVSPRSHFVFTPLLAGTSVGTLEFRTTLEPIRPGLRRGGFFQGWADAVDFSNRTLTVEEAVDDPLQGRALTDHRIQNANPTQKAQEKQLASEKGKLFDITWDKLVIAVGCYAQTFNTKGVKEYAFFLKDVGDARRIRLRLLTCFESAALPTTSTAMKKQLLNFAVIGGGPTGIEWAAELHDLINEDLKKLYPDLVQYVQITVYDVAPKVLSMFDDKLSQYAMNHFKREGINIQTSHHIEELRPGLPGLAPENSKDDLACYTLRTQEEGEVGIGMCVWSTGLMMNPFVQDALAGKVKRDSKTGTITTDGRLQVKQEDDRAIPDVYGIGDCAAIEETAYPATAQVASQKASWLAKRLNKGDLKQQEFTYKNLGVMAYVGNKSAILQSGGGADISGRVAWFVWRSAYLIKSVSWRNRILIPVYWAVNWVFGRDISRF